MFSLLELILARISYLDLNFFPEFATLVHMYECVLFGLFCSWSVIVKDRWRRIRAIEKELERAMRNSEFNPRIQFFLLRFMFLVSAFCL